MNNRNLQIWSIKCPNLFGTTTLFKNKTGSNGIVSTVPVVHVTIRVPIFRKRDKTGLNEVDVLNEKLIVRLDLFRCFVTDGTGHIVPAVGGVLVEDGECAFERFVLLGGPATGGHGG